MPNSTREVFITGGRGYIGMNLTHFLVTRGVTVHNLDSVDVSKFGALPEGAIGHTLDLTDSKAVDLLAHSFKAMDRSCTVIHLAGLKSVEESFIKSNEYQETNVGATQNLLTAMNQSGLSKLIFASTAAVYGDIQNPNPVAESTSTLPISPYAQTKLGAEELIRDANNSWGLRYSTLRFFNVAGSLSPNLIEYSGKNLIPVILRAVEADTAFKVFGDSFATHDGSAVRDYVHIEDLCMAHLEAMRVLESKSVGEINIGSGRGYSVFEIIETLEKLLGHKIKYDIHSARTGDAPSVVADISRAKSLIGWQPSKSLEEMLTSSVKEKSQPH